SGLVAQLRKALGDDRRQERFVRTLHGFGYAFSGEVLDGSGKEAEAPARLIWEETVFALQPGETIVGRSEEAPGRIGAPGVSRRHGRLVVANGEATLEDLGSKNGTFVGEQRIQGATALRDGDCVRLGGQLLVFRLAGAAGATQTESPTPS